MAMSWIKLCPAGSMDAGITPTAVQYKLRIIQ